MFAERDGCTGVSENIMLGQMCPLGTGSFDLLLNEEALQDAFDVQVGASVGVHSMEKADLVGVPQVGTRSTCK